MRSTSEHSHAGDAGPQAPGASAIHLPQAVADRLVKHAERSYPLECCGILIGRREGDATIVEDCLQAENIADGDRSRSYQVDWHCLFNAFRTARDAAVTVVGFYHSHPDGPAGPSRKDHADAWVGHSYVIVSLRAGRPPQITSWRRADEESDLTSERVHLKGDRAADP